MGAGGRGQPEVSEGPSGRRPGWERAEAGSLGRGALPAWNPTLGPPGPGLAAAPNPGLFLLLVVLASRSPRPLGPSAVVCRQHWPLLSQHEISAPSLRGGSHSAWGLPRNLGRIIPRSGFVPPPPTRTRPVHQRVPPGLHPSAHLPTGSRAARTPASSPGRTCSAIVSPSPTQAHGGALSTAGHDSAVVVTRLLPVLRPSNPFTSLFTWPFGQLPIRPSVRPSTHALIRASKLLPSVGPSVPHSHRHVRSRAQPSTLLPHSAPRPPPPSRHPPAVTQRPPPSPTPTVHASMSSSPQPSPPQPPACIRRHPGAQPQVRPSVRSLIRPPVRCPRPPRVRVRAPARGPLLRTPLSLSPRLLNHPAGRPRIHLLSHSPSVHLSFRLSVR